MLFRSVPYALSMAKKFYDKDTYDHVLRVATYIAENPMIDEDNMNDCIALAIMHDLYKDTGYPYHRNQLMIQDEHFLECMKLLRKPDDMKYENYIKNIKEYSNINPEAYWVKISDIKDHLLIDTSDKLKEKYVKALSYLL